MTAATREHAMRAGAPSDREGRLLFALAGTPDRILPEMRIDASIDWDRLLRLALRENAIVALRDQCRFLPAAAIPPLWRHRLAIYSLQVERRMTATQPRLERTLVALNAAGIEPLLLKGAALAITAYGSWTRRPMRDLDLLLSEEQEANAFATAIAAGWTVDASLPEDEEYTQHHHLAPLLDAGGSGLRLELHRSLLPVSHPFTFTAQEIRGDARRVRVGDGTALVMQPHHHLVHLAIHFTWSHAMRSGAWNVCRDVAAMQDAGLVDWDLAVRTARSWSAGTSLYWTLRLARSFSGLEVPNAVLADLKPLLPRAFLDRLERHFSEPLLEGETTCPSVLLAQTMWSAAMQPHLQGHGRARPWRSSTIRIGEQRTAVATRPENYPDHLRRCLAYLSQLV